MFRPVETNLKVIGQNCNESVAHSCKEGRACPSRQMKSSLTTVKLYFPKKWGLGVPPANPLYFYDHDV